MLVTCGRQKELNIIRLGTCKKQMNRMLSACNMLVSKIKPCMSKYASMQVCKYKTVRGEIAKWLIKSFI